MPRSTKKPNRLAQEKSPYLLQHAWNPVNWHPWSQEAFEVARKQESPIFLSIGYSTCHWCHVMEKESFEDEEVAELLNDHFVSIKVDREERPDIDSIYMKVCLLMTGSGGWPLTLILTPEKKPFFAGTYMPKESRGMRLGLVDLLKQVVKLWRDDRAKALTTAESATDRLTGFLKARGREEEMTELLLDEGFLKLLDSFDKTHGGFGIRPKFPSPHNFLFLLRYWKRKGNSQALQMVEETLQKMRRGGVFDHIGFGFHRYSTDAEWLVPHFEKMLYDQAMLSIAYIEAFQATGNKAYRSTAEEIFEYILNTMTSPEGGFFSAEDADSEGEEGKFYLWTKKELVRILGKAAEPVIKAYDIAEEGNYYDEVHRTKTGKNILYLQKPLSELSTELGMSVRTLQQTLLEARLKLCAAREKRVHPFRDDKILANWNGLMIAAFAKGAQALGSVKYAEAARKAAEFVLRKLQTAEGRLLHRFREGEASIDGNLDDYAFLIWGLVELYEATFQAKYLKEALRFHDLLLEHFWDEDEGGFFSAPDYGEQLIVRNKDFRDGALPSGNSVALLNLIRLARMTGATHYEEKAELLTKAFSSYSEGSPSGDTMFLTALDFLIGPSHEIVIVDGAKLQKTRSILRGLQSRFLPNKTLLLKEKGDSTLEMLAAFTKDMKSTRGKTTVYVCRNFTCTLPTTDWKQVLANLED